MEVNNILLYETHTNIAIIRTEIRNHIKLLSILGLGARCARANYRERNNLKTKCERNDG
jgi:hypothetical protein